MPTEQISQIFTPSDTLEQALQCATELWGVQPDYWDIFGRHHLAPPEVQQAVLRSMGVPADNLSSLNAAIERRLREEWSALIAATVVADVDDGYIPIQLRAGERPPRVQAVFRWEDGSVHQAEHVTADLPENGRADIRGEHFRRLRLPLPKGAPLGYHSVTLQAGEASAEGQLILCPKRAYKPPFLEAGGKAGGIGVSLYALRSDRNWGAGDFTDLENLVDWVADEAGASFIALNPLHSIPNRQPYNTSPYLPNCTFYRNPLYLDIERIEDIQHSPWARKLLGSERLRTCLAELRATEYVEYEKVWSIKRRFLKLAFHHFLRDYGEGSPRAQEFRTYVETEGDLLDRYAVYSALDEIIHKRDRNIWIWPDWPEEYRDPSSPAVQEFAQRHRRLVLFYKYTQWQLDLQLAAAHRYAKKRGLSIGLYHDLALATDRCGSDLWAHRPYYVAGCRVGSPPDDFSPKGQDWAFPPPNSICHHENGYRMFVDSIRKNCRHGGALRIDHVMRFFRLFWIPDGREATEGVYVRDFSDDLIRILALESVRNEVIVIGEDLGTVEPYIRVALHDYGILSYRLLYFEKHKDGSFRKPDEYPRQALVSVSTHDLPTLAGFWEGRDIEARKRAGVLPDEASYHEQWRMRQEEKQRLLDVLFSVSLLPDSFPRYAEAVPQFTGELHNAATGFLAGTPSELMLLNGEDLFKQTDQQNLPGTTAEYPNWRSKLRYRIEELRTDSEARGYTAMYRSWLERTGRLNQAGRA